MTLEDSHRLDVVARNRETGEIELAIVAPGDWVADGAMLDQLRDKLEAYVAFATSQEFEDRYGVGPARIELVTDHDLTREAADLVSRVSSTSSIPIDVKRASFPSVFGGPANRPQVRGTLE